jgi:hypothetical protein
MLVRFSPILRTRKAINQLVSGQVLVKSPD